MMKPHRLFPALLLCLLAGKSHAAVKMPAIFSDHMVLQSGMHDPVWGTAAPGEAVTVAIAGQTQKATAGSDGKWMVKLDPLTTGGPFTLTITGQDTVTINDVLVGEVWLGSGQSNMGLTVSRANNFEQEKAAANFPQLRMFIVKAAAPTAAPLSDVRGQWFITTPDNVANFSASLYFFGREIHKTLGVPVGLILSAVGGTPIELWIDLAVQKASPDLKEFFELKKQEVAAFDIPAAQARYAKEQAAWTENSKKPPVPGQKPLLPPKDSSLIFQRDHVFGGLFNAQIAPLIPYAIKGMVWYQGEANTRQPFAAYYRYQLPLLVTDWRKKWGYDFPAVWAQLPNIGLKENVTFWPLVREGELLTLKLPDTGMETLIDVGEGKMHPPNKQEAGRRFGLWALGTVYHQKVPAASGPLPAGHKTKGSEIILSFTHTDGGLVVKGDSLAGFQIAGADHQWKPAVARIDGDTVIVSSPDVKDPVDVRYGWQNLPPASLFNGAGLPASPFRTDHENYFTNTFPTTPTPAL